MIQQEIESWVASNKRLEELVVDVCHKLLKSRHNLINGSDYFLKAWEVLDNKREILGVFESFEDRNEIEIIFPISYLWTPNYLEQDVYIRSEMARRAAEEEEARQKRAKEEHEANLRKWEIEKLKELREKYKDVEID